MCWKALILSGTVLSDFSNFYNFLFRKSAFWLFWTKNAELQMPITFKLLTYAIANLCSIVFSHPGDSENGVMCEVIFISSRDSPEPEVDKTCKLQPRCGTLEY